MVLGRGKSRSIEQEPLLAWYQQLFDHAMKSGDARLLVTGYGFGDPHINTILGDAILNTNLQIFILSPEPRWSFCSRIMKTERGSDLWSGVSGYFQSTLGDLFPASQDDTPEWSMLQERFFESRIR